ncbi:MAG: CoB--CoM heterodisulfide reductase iron-sulfur subunit B family protein [Caldisericia bacterium]|nr:CoB--CoM heterodisulfide reductase iron-sulfur subunit B family protein [Caldisericia bacterium]
MKIPYYPGCTLKTKAKNFEISSIAVAKSLGVEFVEIPRWNCCGAVPSLSSDDLIRHFAPIRNFIRVEEMNKAGIVDNEYRMVTLCAMCYNTLKMSNLRMRRNKEDLDKINDVMYLETEHYKQDVEVVHFLEILKDIDADKLQKNIKNPLPDLKVSPYYGCTLLRPKEIGIDDPEDPKIMENLLTNLSVTLVNNPLKTRCCGSYQVVSDKDIITSLGYDILNNAKRAGAEVIVTSCPLCQFNLDRRQKDIIELHHDFEPIPVLYFTQLMAFLFDLGEETYGFEQNYIDPKKVLNRKELVSN